MVVPVLTFEYVIENIVTDLENNNNNIVPTNEFQKRYEYDRMIGNEAA